MSTKVLKYYINYPQIPDVKPNTFKCKFCGRDTVSINGKLENHKSDCLYRSKMESDLMAGLKQLTQT